MVLWLHLQHPSIRSTLFLPYLLDPAHRGTEWSPCLGVKPRNKAFQGCRHTRAQRHKEEIHDFFYIRFSWRLCGLAREKRLPGLLGIMHLAKAPRREEERYNHISPPCPRGSVVTSTVPIQTTEAPRHGECNYIYISYSPRPPCLRGSITPVPPTPSPGSGRRPGNPGAPRSRRGRRPCGRRRRGRHRRGRRRGRA